MWAFGETLHPSTHPLQKIIFWNIQHPELHFNYSMPMEKCMQEMMGLYKKSKKTIDYKFFI